MSATPAAFRLHWHHVPGDFVDVANATDRYLSARFQRIRAGADVTDGGWMLSGTLADGLILIDDGSGYFVCEIGINGDDGTTFGNEFAIADYGQFGKVRQFARLCRGLSRRGIVLLANEFTHA
jgi:hypothetical protein